MIALLKSVRSWGQLIIHINKRLHVGYILLKGFAFAEETSNSLEVTIDYCLRRRMLGHCSDPNFGLWSVYFAVTWSSTGPIKRFKEMTAAHVGGHG